MSLKCLPGLSVSLCISQVPGETKGEAEPAGKKTIETVKAVSLQNCTDKELLSFKYSNGEMTLVFCFYRLSE